MLSNINKVLVAKTDREDNNAWLPLWMHSKDTTGIIDYLLTEFVSDSFSQSIELEKGQLLQIGRFLAFNHDIGKVTDLFQGKIIIDKPILNTRLEHYGLKIAEEQKQEPEKTPHALAGEVILRHFNVPESVACVVGAHHGMPSSLVNMSKIGMSVRDQSLDLAGKDACCQLNYYGNLANKQQWQDMWKNWLGVSLVESGYKSVKDLPKLSKMAQILLSGLIIMADWIASNTKLFPLLELDDLGDKDVYPSRVEKAWEQLNFPPSWNPVQDSYSAMRFRQQFNFNANSVQATVLQAVSESNSPGIYILEAPMGCGKTEAALAASEILASKYNKTGVFFGLPTQATANGIYARFKKWCESQSEDENHSIKLVYKDSEMYEPFRKIQSNIPMKASEESVGGLLVHNWFSGKKQSCLVSFAVGTVDQMLMAALKRKHVMLLHLGLSEKVVIIDECHAYDAYMNQYLERSLQWLGMYGVPVVLLSATLPANRRMELIKAYQNERSIDNKLADSKSYPLLTWTNGKKINQRIIPYDGESKEVIITEIPECDIVNAVQKAIANKGCVGVIANTVTRAQELAQLLREKTNGEVILYHARYIMPDRADKEAEILSRVGKESKPTQRKKLIVVGTQVLEQSLDIDFDLLITEWCPMDLLLQRIG
ncbi:MAG TPA: CRISPR-associated helicase Cas3', partial [Oscillospiraceae bacterium]|nr:CRISPR-associated helicase Cas3' [Oscillospiraceae bacterium]